MFWLKVMVSVGARVMSALGYFRGHSQKLTQTHISQIRREDPLDLSISVSGGKETNKDSLSNGE